MPIDASRVVWDAPARKPAPDVSAIVWDDEPSKLAQPATATTTGWHGVGNELLGLGETALALGTGAVRGLQGGLGTLGGFVLGDSPAEAAKYGQDIMASGYQPRTESGRANMEALGNVFAVPGKVLGAIGSGAVRGYGALTGQNIDYKAEQVGELGEPAGQIALTLAGARPAMVGANAAARGVAATGRAVLPKNIPVMAERFLPGGAQRVAGRIQRDIAGAPEMRAKLVEALRNADEIVKGSTPTAGELVSSIPEGSPIVASQARIAAQTGERAGAPSTLFGRRWKEQNEAIEAAKSERDAVTGPMREAALDSAGMVSAEPVMTGIRDMLSEVGERTNKVRADVLTDAYKDIASFSDSSGMISAHDLYGIRKTIGLKIGKLINERAAWDKKQAGATDRRVQLLIDDAIDANNTHGWRAYLNEFATRSRKIDADIARREAMNEQLQPSTLGKQETESAITASTMFNPLERNVMLANALLRAAGKRTAPKVVATMAQQYLTPELLAKALEKGIATPELTTPNVAVPASATTIMAAPEVASMRSPTADSVAKARAIRELNATDPLKVSQESINARAADAKAGLRTVRVRADESVEPLPGMESRDPAPIRGEPVLSISKGGEVTILDRAGMSPTALQGLINRLRAHGKLD